MVAKVSLSLCFKMITDNIIVTCNELNRTMRTLNGVDRIKETTALCSGLI